MCHIPLKEVVGCSVSYWEGKVPRRVEGESTRGGTNKMQQDQFPAYGHEEANARMIARALGPQLADQVFRTAPGTPPMSQRISQDIPQYTHVDGQVTNNGQRYAQEAVSQVYTREGDYVGAVSGGNNQQNSVASYNTQQYGNNTQTQGFSGYGSPSPVYGQGHKEWTMTRDGQAMSSYRDRLPKVFGVPIVAVRKDGRGNILAFKLEDSRVLDYEQMLQANAQGGLSGLRVQENREGELIIRSVPDGFSDNNLDNLPQF